MHRLALVLLPALLLACATEPEPDVRGQAVDYRRGIAADDYRSSGERGNVTITEVMWAGSVKGTGRDRVHDPDDVFIELQNKHPRPIHLTGWQISIEAGYFLDGISEPPSGNRARHTYIIPLRESRQPVQQNEFVVIARKRDGAFDADYYIDDLALPDGPFEIVLTDIDNRLIESAGDARKPAFAGAWDRITARSMERVQIIFNNRGDRDAAWHTYSLNDFDDGERLALHTTLRARVREAWRPLTGATPGMPNSPDYSGYISSGSFE
ncbi:MAG: hypothetical protein KC620_07070 [Myxococcales bacterium]|nr:hypothetical protein [Myxococcales bacterium]